MLFSRTIIQSVLQTHGDLFKGWTECVTHRQALWWVRLRPGSDDSSRLSGCPWVKGIFVLILCAHYYYCYKLQRSNLGLVLCRVLEMFCLYGCVLFLSGVDWNKILWQGYKGTVNPIIHVSIVKLLCLRIQLKLPQGNVEHLHCRSWILFHCQTLWFHYPVLQNSIFPFLLSKA